MPDLCPCGTRRAYASCCGKLHAGSAAPSAEALMRSRYAAYALGDEPYLLASWHPTTRPPRVEIDPDLVWTGLEILVTERGGPLDDDGIVEFVARHAIGGTPGELRERSRFVRERGRWTYLGLDFGLAGF